MNSGKAPEPHELILDHLRAIRADLTRMERKQDTMAADLLSLRREMNGIRGDILRVEENAAGLSIEIERINVRLGLNDTPQ